MENRLKILNDFLGGERVKRREDLSSHLFFKKKIIAEAFYIATNINELKQALNLAYELKIPYKILGGGTKITFSKKNFNGLVIKNRTSSIKIAGIKGKVGRVGLGVEEALIEVDSGVSLGRLNEYLHGNNFFEISGFSFQQASVGSSIFFDIALRTFAQKITLWSDGEIWDAKLEELETKNEQALFSENEQALFFENKIVLTVTFKFKSI